MTQWYVKDLSRLTDVSVQTLHHYDRIDLLKPSVRLENGYRVYSKHDLLKLQQIIALKFFGFELSKIKALLTDDAGALDHLSTQAKFLEQKANTLLEASQTLKTILFDVKDNKSIPWETIIQLIEVYRMTQQLEHSWVKEIYTPDELKQYAEFEAEFKSNSTEAAATFQTNWRKLVEEINKNLQQDPKSAIGIKLGKRCMELVNGIYGKKYAHLRTKKFEKGFAAGKGLDEVGLTPESVAWLDKAIDAYWYQRAYTILAQVGKGSSKDLLKQWNELLDDIYGNENARKYEGINLLLNDANVGSEAKKWLKSL